MSENVRPTRRCLNDLSVGLPDLGTLLHEVEHPLVMKAQQLPDQARARSAERIRSLTDRVWLKVKTASWRGVGGELPPVVESIEQSWWIAAAGPRAADSPQHDFYSRIEAEAHAAGRNSCDSTFLLPTGWDRDRLWAEAAVRAERIVRSMVRRAAGESLLNGDIRSFDVGDRNVRVRIQMLDGDQVYMAIGATGSIDSEFMTTLFAAIPGLLPDDWMPEPSDILGFEPAPGEILWSAMISPETQEQLLADSEREW